MQKEGSSVPSISPRSSASAGFRQRTQGDPVGLLEARMPTTRSWTFTCSLGKPSTLPALPPQNCWGKEQGSSVCYYQVTISQIKPLRSSQRRTHPYPQEHKGGGVWAIRSPGHGGHSASRTPCPAPPASSVGLAVNLAGCAWLLGLSETLWEKQRLGLCVLGCPQGRRSEASSLPLPFVDLIYHMTSPRQHEHPLPLPGPSQEV